MDRARLRGHLLNRWNAGILAAFYGALVLLAAVERSLAVPVGTTWVSVGRWITRDVFRCVTLWPCAFVAPAVAFVVWYALVTAAVAGCRLGVDRIRK